MLSEDDVRPHLVGDALRRRWWIVGLVAVLFAAAAVGAALMRNNSYTATTSVYLQPLSGNALDSNAATNGQQITIAMETEASLVTSPGVTKLANARANSVAEEASDVDATVPTNTQIVQIDYTASSPERARAGAMAYGNAFLQFREERAKSSQGAKLEALQKQADEVRSKLRDATQAASKNDAAPEARSQVEIYTARLSTLQDSIGAAQISPGSPGFVVTPAAKPSRPDGLSPLVLIVAAALAGLGVGGAVAVWRERRDDRLRGEVDVQVDGVPILATVPTSVSPRLASESGDTAEDAYRRARVATLACLAQRSVVLLCELRPSGGTGEVVTNVAMSLADSGYSIVVVDTEGATAAKLLGLDDGGRLAEVLSTGRVTKPLPTRGRVKLLAGGLIEAGARDRLASATTRTVLKELSGDCDYVLVAGGTTKEAESDALALSCEGVVLLVDDYRATRSEVSQWIQRKKWLGIEVLGIIATEPERGSGSHRKQTARPPQKSRSLGDHDVQESASFPQSEMPAHVKATK